MSLFLRVIGCAAVILGAVVATLQADPLPEILADDGLTAAASPNLYWSYSGTWSSTTTPLASGGSFHKASTDNTGQATLNAQITEAGVYELKMRWPDASKLSPKVSRVHASVTVNYTSNGQAATCTKLVEQVTHGGQWNTLGYFSFDKTSGPQPIMIIKMANALPAFVDSVSLIKVEPSTETKAINATPVYYKAWNNILDHPNGTAIGKQTKVYNANILLHTTIPSGGRYHVYFRYPNAGTRSTSVAATVYSDSDGSSPLVAVAKPANSVINESLSLGSTAPADWVWIGDYNFPYGAVKPSIRFTNGDTNPAHFCLVESVRFDLCTDSNFTRDIANPRDELVYTVPDGGGWSTIPNPASNKLNFGADRLSNTLKRLTSLQPAIQDVKVTFRLQASGRFKAYVFNFDDALPETLQASTQVTRGSSSGYQAYPVKPGSWNALGEVVIASGIDSAVVAIKGNTPSSAKNLNVDAIRLVPVALLDSQPNGVDDNVEKVFWNRILTKAESPSILAANRGDGMSAAQALAAGLDPLKLDTDGDGMPDRWELDHGLSPFIAEATGNPDNDKLLNWQEYVLGTDPKVSEPDTKSSDTDGLPDYWEFQAGNWSQVAGVWTRQSGPNPLVNDGDALDPTAQGATNDTGMTYLQRFQLGLTPKGTVLFDQVNASLSANAVTEGGTVNLIFTRVPLGNSQPNMRGKEVTINYSIGSDSTAVDGTHYTMPVTRSVILSSNQNTITVAINALPTSLDEGTRSVKIHLEPGIYSRGTKDTTLGINDLAGSGLDPDHDGLTNYQEVFESHTDPNNFDSDKDFLPDGWEISNGLNPHNSTGNNGTDGNTDNDGLNNLGEYLNGTSPSNPDSDGDGATDGAETSSGGNPTDASDSGQAPPAEEMSDVPFRVGGDFASWEMIVTGQGPDDHREQKLITAAPGKWADRSLKLRHGNTYEIRMRWLKTLESDTANTWYCWEAMVDGHPGESTFESYKTERRSDAAGALVAEAFGVGGHWLADNRDGLLCPHTHMYIPNDKSLPPHGKDVADSAVATLIPIDIQPDSNVAGVVGDVVKSAKAGSSMEHFVTPKKSNDLNQDYVELKAVGVDTAMFSKFLEWEGGEAGSAADKRKVKRDATGMTEMKIRTQKGKEVVAQMDVWVVWADAAVTALAAPQKSQWFGSTRIQGLITYVYTVDPSSMILDEEKPKLSGQITSPVPNGNKAHLIDGDPLKGGADKKWDTSRQIRVRVINPKLYTIAQLGPNNGHLWQGQPAAQTTPEDYPNDSVEGNDDARTTDEVNDPYANEAKLLSTDSPFSSRDNSVGVAGDTFAQRYHYREFLRLNLGSKWYRVSDQKLWRIHFEFKKSAAEWEDNGSVLQQDNQGW